MAKVTPDQAAAKWAQRSAAATEDVKTGVMNVTEAPGKAAARQKDLWLQRISASADKWARRVSSVTLSEWQDAMINKGAARVGTGASAAQSKMANAMTQLLPKIDSIVAALPPRGDLGANISRMTQFVTQMSQVQISK